MCLGVPGQVVEVIHNEIGVPMGKVDFSGVVKEVCFAYTPEVAPGQWVVVHVGFAISLIDELEAKKVFRYLDEIGELLELQDGERGDSGPAQPAAGPRQASLDSGKRS